MDKVCLLRARLRGVLLLKLFLISILSSRLLVSSFAAESNQESIEIDRYTTETSYISGRDYYPAVKKAIREAKESIYMAMYLVALNPNDKNSPVYELVNELIDSKRRGVNVKVILDQDIGPDKIDDRYKPRDKNTWAYKMLKDAGIDARYDDPLTTSHAKAIVIDGETSILGSSNWSQSAFDKNFEANVLIHSKELAKRLLKDLEGIKIGEYNIIPGALDEYVPISWRFLEDERLAGLMMTRHDERAFDLYLILLKEFDGNPDGLIAIDYERIASISGLADKGEIRGNKGVIGENKGKIWEDKGRIGEDKGLIGEGRGKIWEDKGKIGGDRESYRREINRTLRKLEKEYRLISFKPQFGKDAIAILLDHDEPTKPYSIPRQWHFKLPHNFWKFGWDGRLSMRAKFSYLINLAYMSISDTRPWWSSKVSALAKRFNVSEWTITTGMQELRRQNLIDVLYDENLGFSYEKRRAKSYKVLALYDPVLLEGEWDRLELIYGLKNLRRARRYAEIVFKENSPEIVEDISKMMNSYGEKMVREAFAIAARKHIDNPKRCYAYVKGIIDKWQLKEF